MGSSDALLLRLLGGTLVAAPESLLREYVVPALFDLWCSPVLRPYFYRG